MSFNADTLDAALRAALAPSQFNSARDSASASLSARLGLAIVVLGGAVQGAFLGSYAVCNGGSPLFILFAAVKVPLFLGLSSLLIFPALRVLYTLWGLANDWEIAVRGYLAAQTAFALILASLSPCVLVFYLSGLSYRGALMVGILQFVVAIIAAQNGFKSRWRELRQRDARHATLGKIGLSLWIFVAVQLAWNIRPFIGSPAAPLQFLRPDAFSNAYFGLWHILFG